MATLLQTLYQTLRVQRKRRCWPCILAAFVDYRLKGKPTCPLTITVQSGKCYLHWRLWEPSRGSSDGGATEEQEFQAKPGQAACGGGGTSRRDAQRVTREQAWKGHHRERGLERKEPGRELEELENER